MFYLDKNSGKTWPSKLEEEYGKVFAEKLCQCKNRLNFDTCLRLACH
jgi:hypothetical protein